MLGGGTNGVMVKEKSVNLQRGKTSVFPLSNKQHDSIGNDMVVQPREDR